MSYEGREPSIWDGFLRWFLTGETEAHQWHRELDEVKRELAATKPMIDKLARGGYGGMSNEQISREINKRGRR